MLENENVLADLDKNFFFLELQFGEGHQILIFALEKDMALLRV